MVHRQQDASILENKLFFISIISGKNTSHQVEMHLLDEWWWYYDILVLYTNWTVVFIVLDIRKISSHAFVVCICIVINGKFTTYNFPFAILKLFFTSVCHLFTQYSTMCEFMFYLKGCVCINAFLVWNIVIILYK